MEGLDFKENCILKALEIFGSKVVYDSLEVLEEANIFKKCLKVKFPTLFKFLDEASFDVFEKEQYVVLRIKEKEVLLKHFLEDIGSTEWMDEFLDSFNGDKSKFLEESFIKFSVPKKKTSGTSFKNWREPYLLNESDILYMISEAEFVLEYSPVFKRFRVIDRQEANLGGIENETFESLYDVLERMAIYWIDLYDEEDEEEDETEVANVNSN